MRISDWSSDVCSSDLPLSAITNYTAACLRLIEAGAPSEKALSEAVGAIHKTSQRAGNIIKSLRNLASRREPNREQARKTVVQGKSVSVRVDLGGGCIIQKKKIYMKKQERKNNS